MSTKQTTVDYILDQLTSIPDVWARKMFGEYALYAGGKVVGLVCDDTLYIKITDEGKEFVGKYYEEGYAYEGAKVSMVINEDLIDDREWLGELINTTASNLPMSKKKLTKTVCSRGHAFSKSKDIPTCPVCWPGRYKIKNA